MSALQVGEEITVGPYARSDLRELVPVIESNREYLRQWIGFVSSVRSDAEHRSRLERLIARQRRGELAGGPIRQSGTIVGEAELGGLRNGNRSASLMYWLAEDAQGRGIVTAVCWRLLALAFYELRLNRVEISAATENQRSRAVAERLGMRLEGVLREYHLRNGKLHDLAIYSMLAREWTGRGEARADSAEAKART
ncbi:MAG: GNAT family N-acetyltransferase [Chloroflexota bacterium]